MLSFQKKAQLTFHSAYQISIAKAHRLSTHNGGEKAQSSIVIFLEATHSL